MFKTLVTSAAVGFVFIFTGGDSESENDLRKPAGTRATVSGSLTLTPPPLCMQCWDDV